MDVLKVLDKEGYEEYYFSKSLIGIRVTIFLCIFIYIILRFTISTILPHSKGIFLFLDAIMIIWCSLLAALSFSKSFKNYYQPILGITTFLMGYVNLSVIAFAQKGELGYSICYDSLFLILFGTTALYRCKLWISALNGTLILLGYTLIYIFKQPGLVSSNHRILFFNNMFYLSATFGVSLLSHYLFDYYLRRDFNNILTINQANLKLQELDKAKSKFLVNISHEFRTPLTLILSPLEAVIQGNYGKMIESNHFILQTIRNNTLRLLGLINNLLDLSKLEAGRMTINLKRMNISKLIEFYIANVISAAENKGLKLIYHDYTKGLTVYIDPNLFEKAIFNLISNALKFTPPGGKIVVELNETGNEDEISFGEQSGENQTGYFQISVTDTGIGIPEDKLVTIFERFSQLDDSSVRKYEGTGIGLALTKEIVELSGGKIEVKSKTGEGSTFIITLPIQVEETPGNEANFESSGDINPYILSDIPQGITAPPVNANASMDAKSFRILIVEDNPEMISFLTSILDKEYNIVTAANGLEGIRTAGIYLPDLILSDVMMPEMDGYEMTARLRQNDIFQGIPIILLTAKAEIPMKIEGLELGATDYIAKPFNARELIARIKSQLDMKRLRDEIASQKETLAKSEVRFREMADFLPSAIIETNKDFEITYLNQAAIKILGLTQPDFTKAICLKEFIHFGDQQRFDSEMSNILHKGTPGVYEYKFQSQDGQDFLVLLKATLLIDQNNIRLRMAMIEINTFFNLVALPDEAFYKKYQITDKEKSILMEVLMGRRNKEIGEKFFISEIAVKKHISNLFQKTGVNSRSELFKLIQGEKNHPATSRPLDD